MIYDDDYLTLGAGWLLVDQSDGTFPPFAIVRGSKRYPRDPRLLQTEAQLLRRALKTMEHDGAHTGKWCPDCGEYRAKSMFNKDATRADGLAAYCRAHAGVHEKLRRLRAKYIELGLAG